MTSQSKTIGQFLFYLFISLFIYLFHFATRLQEQKHKIADSLYNNEVKYIEHRLLNEIYKIKHIAYSSLYISGSFKLKNRP